MDEVLSITPQMMVVMGLLLLTIILFITEIVRLDVAAISIMVLLGLLSMVPGLEGVVDTSRIFSGFSSNAVIAIIAVMIMGAGLDRTGAMRHVAGWILRAAGAREKRLIPILAGLAGLLSGFVQNAGAATLFLPILSRVSARTGLALSRLLMPVGYCILLGGTLTLVGSSPLIMLNDLLPHDIDPLALFDVLPIGAALLSAGIIYFASAGRRLVPNIRSDAPSGGNTMEYFKKVYGLDVVIREVRLQRDAPWAGRTVDEVEKRHGVVIVATFMKGEIRVGPWSGLTVEAGARLAVLARPDWFSSVKETWRVEVLPSFDVFSDALSYLESGIAELVIAPASQLAGKTAAEVAMRKTYGLSVLAIHRGEETIRSHVRDVPLRAGDSLVCHCAWNTLMRLERDPDIVVVTSDYPHEERRPQKVFFALFFFLLAMALAVFTNVLISVAFFTGALGMVLTRVLSMDEAYRAVSWRTVFLLAGMLPLGMAVQNTGTASWLAHHLLQVMGGAAPWMIQAMLAVLATVCTLVMTNIGATVLLVPIAIQTALLAQGMGLDADPRVFALTVAIVASNGFLLPTNPVMSIFAGPGGYRSKDFIKVGAPLTALFLLVTILMLNLMY